MKSKIQTKNKLFYIYLEQFMQTARPSSANVGTLQIMYRITRENKSIQN